MTNPLKTAKPLLVSDPNPFGRRECVMLIGDTAQQAQCLKQYGLGEMMLVHSADDALNSLNEGQSVVLSGRVRTHEQQLDVLKKLPQDVFTRAIPLGRSTADVASSLDYSFQSTHAPKGFEPAKQGGQLTEAPLKIIRPSSPEELARQASDTRAKTERRQR